MAAQLAFDVTETAFAPRPARLRPAPDASAMCAACRAREARYGFRTSDDDPTLDRPRTLCFECFRVEINRRQAIAERLKRGWNASQTRLPLEDTLESLRRRRGRAQIAARKALELR